MLIEAFHLEDELIFVYIPWKLLALSCPQGECRDTPAMSVNRPEYLVSSAEKMSEYSTLSYLYCHLCWRRSLHCRLPRLPFLFAHQRVPMEETELCLLIFGWRNSGSFSWILILSENLHPSHSQRTNTLAVHFEYFQCIWMGRISLPLINICLKIPHSTAITEHHLYF
jgi:hypothetical protein